MSTRKSATLLVGLLFVGWVGFLAWQTRHSHSVVVSRSQWSVAPIRILATVTANPDGRPSATLREVEGLHGQTMLPMADTFDIANLPDARGFQGTGRYFVMLSQVGNSLVLTPIPRSVGYETEQRPLIYTWNSEVQKQVDELAAK